ncbi:hypothetical protein DPMN_059070 [Dreissena polymorpha]|uniref:Uncharacterized protein n=1 Tax=Dreissena polymorpha TaxID=45954 RepID=A0A9D4C390_DREPO|nr:hypothetical protein DPMN_059070 [Dreissena polymorpha]
MCFKEEQQISKESALEKIHTLVSKKSALKTNQTFDSKENAFTLYPIRSKVKMAFATSIKPEQPASI